MGGVQGFAVPDVDAGPGDLPRPQRVGERCFIDDASARGQHDVGVRLHERKLASIDQVPCLGDERCLDRQVVSLSERVVEEEQFDAHRSGIGAVDERVEGDDPHVESGGAAGDRPRDVAERQEAEGLAGHPAGVRHQRGATCPFLAHRTVEGDDLAVERE